MSHDTKNIEEEIVKLVSESWAEGSVWTAEEVASTVNSTPENVKRVIDEHNKTAEIELELSTAVYSYYEDPDEAALFTNEVVSEDSDEEEEDSSLFSMITKQLAVSAVVFALCCVASYLIFS